MAAIREGNDFRRRWKNVDWRTRETIKEAVTSGRVVPAHHALAVAYARRLRRWALLVFSVAAVLLVAGAALALIIKGFAWHRLALLPLFAMFLYSFLRGYSALRKSERLNAEGVDTAGD